MSERGGFGSGARLTTTALGGLAAALAFLLALLGPSGGAAARAESPESLYKRGVDLRRAHKDTEALDVFKQLFEQEKTPRVLAQLGTAEQALGLWVEAEGHLQEALKYDHDPWIKKNGETLTKALAEIHHHLGTIDVWGEPPGAEVLVDGKVVGTLPLGSPVPVVAGDFPVTVRSPGYFERTIVVNVRPNQASRERFVLQRVETAQPTGGAPAGGAGEVKVARAPDVEPPVTTTPQATLVQQPSTPEPDAGPSTLRRTAKWVAFGAGAAALGVGIFGAVRDSSAGSDFNSACGLDASGTPRARPGSGKTDAGCSGLKSDVDSAYRLEVIGLASAAALGAVGVVLWLTEPKGGEAHTTGVACAPEVGGGPSTRFALACALRF
jgi:hypothetical protein